MRYDSAISIANPASPDVGDHLPHGKAFGCRSRTASLAPSVARLPTGHTLTRRGICPVPRLRISRSSRVTGRTAVIGRSSSSRTPTRIARVSGPARHLLERGHVLAQRASAAGTSRKSSLLLPLQHRSSPAGLLRSPTTWHLGAICHRPGRSSSILRTLTLAGGGRCLY